MSDLPPTPIEGLLEADQMAFRARALAQSEAFTNMARKIIDTVMTAEREAQPGNFSVWANAAVTKGYCVRCVEEDDVGMRVAVPEEDGAMPPVEDVLKVTDELVVALRSDDIDLSKYMIGSEDRLFDVLDQVIGSEVRNRTDNAGQGETLSARKRIELEDYLTYWVVKGYALRTAELETGALVKA